MKKAVVLFISLLFISALSILILKNLDDTNTYVKEQNSSFNKIQMIVLMNNLQTQISKIFQANQEMIDSFLINDEEISFPLQIKDSELLFTVKNYDKVDINLLSKEIQSDSNLVLDLFNEYAISNYDGFRSIYLEEEIKYKLKDEIFINNSKQLDYLVNKAIIETYNKDLEKIRNSLGFISVPIDKIMYEVYIKIKHNNEFSKAYYILNTKGEVHYFESSFK